MKKNEKLYNYYSFYIKIYKNVDQLKKKINIYFALILSGLLVLLLFPLSILPNRNSFSEYKVLIFATGHLQKSLVKKIYKFLPKKSYYFKDNINKIYFNLKYFKAVYLGSLMIFKIILKYFPKSIFDFMGLRLYRDAVVYNYLISLLPIPKYYIHLNDLSPLGLMLKDYYESLDSKSIYIQHASVTSRFPSLSSDINLLFSDDSLSKYKNKFNKKFFLLNDLRYVDRKISNKKLSNNFYILIAFNKRDELSQIKKVIRFLDRKSNVKNIILRPHPDDNRNLNFFNNQVKVKISDSSLENDLLKSNLILVNESNVILDALAFGCGLIKCSFFGQDIDNYGFVKNNLVQYDCKSLLSFKKLLKTNIPNNFKSKKMNLKYYVGDLSKGIKIWEYHLNKILK